MRFVRLAADRLLIAFHLPPTGGGESAASYSTGPFSQPFPVGFGIRAY
jgi:hypothetical protein